MGCKRITVSDIAYIEAMKDNCIIHMIDGKRYTQSCPMGDIEPELNPQMFKRIHRSFIVNIRYIDMYYYGHVVLENGMEVHIGDKYRDALKSSFHFWGSKMFAAHADSCFAQLSKFVASVIAARLRLLGITNCC